MSKNFFKKIEKAVKKAGRQINKAFKKAAPVLIPLALTGLTGGLANGTVKLSSLIGKGAGHAWGNVGQSLIDGITNLGGFAPKAGAKAGEMIVNGKAATLAQTPLQKAVQDTAITKIAQTLKGNKKTNEDKAQNVATIGEDTLNLLREAGNGFSVPTITAPSVSGIYGSSPIVASELSDVNPNNQVYGLLYGDDEQRKKQNSHLNFMQPYVPKFSY